MLQTQQQNMSINFILFILCLGWKRSRWNEVCCKLALEKKKWDFNMEIQGLLDMFVMWETAFSETILI